MYLTAHRSEVSGLAEEEQVTVSSLGIEVGADMVDKCQKIRQRSCGEGYVVYSTLQTRFKICVAVWLRL